MNSSKKGMTLIAKQRVAGWTFLTPATLMIAIMSFWPMIQAFIISLQTGTGANMRFAEPIFNNYKRILADKVFQQSIVNTFLYLLIQVPIMLLLAILLAQLLNNQQLRFKGLFRTCVFLIRLRLSKAADLLRTTSVSIGDICASCGYPNQLYFSQAFKQHYGLPPREWRAKNKVDRNR